MTTPHPVTDRQHVQLTSFAERVAGSPHNLVSRRAREELLSRHVPESARLAALLPGDGPLLDVGSGGGFPGLVVAILRPDLEVHLLDATRKKAQFLRDTAEGLRVDVVVHHGRAEDLARTELAARFGMVTARAVASLADLLPWTLPFLRRGGALYAVKGDRWREELDAATGELAHHGATVLATPDDVDVPPVDGLEGPAPRVVILGRAP